jgi:hypothetical protein
MDSHLQRELIQDGRGINEKFNAIQLVAPV